MLALMPHGVCYVWDLRLVGLHAVADGLIALAYFSIPAALFYLLRRRPDYPFRRTISWFGIFIVACGVTHMLEVVSIWHPIYWTSGLVKAATAAISLGVAFVLWRMRDLFLAAPTQERYRQLNEKLDQLVRERTADLTAINERLAAEIEQRRSAEKYSEDLNHTLFERVAELHTLIDILPAGVAIATDPECTELRHNRAFARLFEIEGRKHPLDEPLDRRELNAVRVFRDGLEQPVAKRPMQLTAATGEPSRDVELRLVLPSGLEREVLVSAEPLLEIDGRTRGCVAVYQDITARKQEEHDLRLVVEAAPNAMIIAGEDGRIILANTEAHRLFGYAGLALRGQPIDILLPADLRDRHHTMGEGFSATPTRRAMGAGREVFGLRRDGERVPLEIGLNPIHLSSGPAVLASIIDLTDRKRAEEERLQFERSMHETQKLESLGVLAGGIAHDFNNLLTGVLGHSSLLRHDCATALPDALESIEQIEISAERAADLCQQLMAYAGKGRFEQKPFDLSTLVTETGKLLDVSVGKVARLRFRLTPKLPAVVGDATQLRQVLMNLVINASEAVEPKVGTINVSTGLVDGTADYLASLDLPNALKPGPYVTLEVQDNGRGMDEATRARIFDPFFTTKFTGRGLGLAAVQGIVHGHGGGIRVYSEPDRGTLFKVLLPAAPTSAAPAVAAAPAPLTEKLRGRVLVIDDEPAVRHLAESALRHFGFDVQPADSGPTGLERVQRDPTAFDLVLVDLTMPEMDGDTVIQELRKLAPQVPILLMSGFNEQDTIQRIGHRQPNAFLSKPFTIDSLLQKVRVCLDLAGERTNRAPEAGALSSQTQK